MTHWTFIGTCDEFAFLIFLHQLWCAAGVNLSGGKTRDGGSIVGASVFYSDMSVPESPKKKIGSQSSVEKLDQELKVHPLLYSL